MPYVVSDMGGARGEEEPPLPLIDEAFDYLDDVNLLVAQVFLL